MRGRQLLINIPALAPTSTRVKYSIRSPRQIQLWRFCPTSGLILFALSIHFHQRSMRRHPRPLASLAVAARHRLSSISSLISVCARELRPPSLGRPAQCTESWMAIDVCSLATTTRCFFCFRACCEIASRQASRMYFCSEACLIAG